MFRIVSIVAKMSPNEKAPTNLPTRTARSEPIELNECIPFSLVYDFCDDLQTFGEAKVRF